MPAARTPQHVLPRDQGESLTQDIGVDVLESSSQQTQEIPAPAAHQPPLTQAQKDWFNDVWSDNIEAAAHNKITVKNAWNFQGMAGLKELAATWGRAGDFHKGSVCLEVAAKIFSCRVDALMIQADQVRSFLRIGDGKPPAGAAALGAEEGAAVPKAKKRKTQRETTVATVEELDMKPEEMAKRELRTDPLFTVLTRGAMDKGSEGFLMNAAPYGRSMDLMIETAHATPVFALPEPDSTQLEAVGDAGNATAALLEQLSPIADIIASSRVEEQTALAQAEEEARTVIMSPPPATAPADDDDDDDVFGADDGFSGGDDDDDGGISHVPVATWSEARAVSTRAASIAASNMGGRPPIETPVTAGMDFDVEETGEMGTGEIESPDAQSPDAETKADDLFEFRQNKMSGALRRNWQGPPDSQRLRALRKEVQMGRAATQIGSSMDGDTTSPPGKGAKRKRSQPSWLAALSKDLGDWPVPGDPVDEEKLCLPRRGARVGRRSEEGFLAVDYTLERNFSAIDTARRKEGFRLPTDLGVTTETFFRLGCLAECEHWDLLRKWHAKQSERAKSVRDPKARSTMGSPRREGSQASGSKVEPNALPEHIDLDLPSDAPDAPEGGDDDSDGDVGAGGWSMPAVSPFSPQPRLSDSITLPAAHLSPGNLEDEAVVVAHARMAKVVDIKRLKELMWACMRRKPRREDLKYRRRVADKKEWTVDAPTLSGLIQHMLPRVIEGRVAPRPSDITFPFYFLCLLHLTNEHGLVLTQTPDLSEVLIDCIFVPPTPSPKRKGGSRSPGRSPTPGGEEEREEDAEAKER